VSDEWERLAREVAALRRRVEALEHGPEVGGVGFDWVPTLTQGVAVTFTADLARYTTQAQTVTVTCRLGVTSAGMAGQAITIGGLPFAPLYTSAYAPRGAGEVFVAAVGAPRGGMAMTPSGTTVKLREANLVGYLGVGAVTLANGDVIGFTVTYERA
jgi:hypothetical protein